MSNVLIAEVACQDSARKKGPQGGRQLEDCPPVMSIDTLKKAC
jgi:hypothetical protein